MKAPLILASASPRRRELLGQLGREFKIVPSSAAEIQPSQLSPGEIARANAFRKAMAVALKNPEALVIGMDTVVALGNEVFGKPVDLEDAHRMLSRLQNRLHTVVTGVCLIHIQTRRRMVFAELTDVRFRALSEAQIRQYHAQVNPLDKAGAYGIQEKGELIVESISGSFSNVVGLPLERLEVELDRWGQTVPVGV
jgi:septum formation protein